MKRQQARAGAGGMTVGTGAGARKDSLASGWPRVPDEHCNRLRYLHSHERCRYGDHPSRMSNETKALTWYRRRGL